MWGNDNADAVAAMPAIPAATGNPMGWWSPGDPYGTGALPSEVTFDHLNILFAEFLNILTAASVAPNKANTSQVLASLQALFAPLGSIPTAWTALSATTAIQVPAGRTRIEVYAVGGGGGGSNCASKSANGDASGGGGGAGGFIWGIYAVTPGANLTATVGAGAAAQNAGGATSLAAGSSTLFTASGGGASAFGQNSSSAGGAGGAATGVAGTLVAARGQDGSDGQATIGSNTWWFAGNGGGGPWGGGGRAGDLGGSGANAPGAGGGGAYDATLSGNTYNGGGGGGGLILYRFLP